MQYSHDKHETRNVTLSIQIHTIFVLQDELDNQIENIFVIAEIKDKYKSMYALQRNKEKLLTYSTLFEKKTEKQC